MDLSNIKNKNIIITAGGTGGHIFPALAVAEALKKAGANVTWVGTKDSMEDKLISGKFDIKYIKSSGVRGKGIARKFTFPFTLTQSILSALKILKQTKADLVIGFGGYVSGPICIAARLKKTPVIIHEQNAKMGLTNRTLAKFVDEVCLAFPIDNLSQYFKEHKLSRFHIVGNPVRESIINLNSQNKQFSTEGLNLLVLGGSQGARAINNLIPQLIIKANAENINIKIWHQTGKSLLSETINLYDTIPAENIYNISAFIDDMVDAYKWADLVICRAGALTVSEVAISGVPAIFIPLPMAVDDHQYYNAHIMAENHAGFNIRQNEANIEKLTKIINDLNTNRYTLREMSDNAKKTLIKDSTAQILAITNKVLDK